MIKKITIQHSLNYDLILCLAKLTNFNEVEDLFRSYDGDLLQKFKMNEELNKWMEKSLKKIPDKLFKIMKVFFNRKAFLGLDFLAYVRENNLNSIEEFLSFIESFDPEDIVIKHIISLGYTISETEISEKEAKEILKEDSKIMELLEKTSLSPEIKWQYLQFFKDPSLLKNQFQELLNWFYTNIFKKEIKKINKIIKKYEKKLKSNLKKYGKDYLELLMNTDLSNVSLSENKIIIALSYFMEIGYIGFEQVKNKETIFVFGYRHMEIFVERKHGILSNVHLFKAIADETRQNLLKLLARKEWYGDEIAKEMNLSNSTVSYHLNILMIEGFIKVNRRQNRSYFTLNKEKFKSIIDDAVNRIIT